MPAAGDSRLAAPAATSPPGAPPPPIASPTATSPPSAPPSAAPSSPPPTALPQSPALRPPRVVTAPPPHPLEWARRVLPHYFSDEPAPFHEELLSDLAAGTRLIARVAPRGHAKSTCASLAYPLWCIAHGLRRNIVLVTHENSLAMQFVRDIRQELVENEHLRPPAGEGRGETASPARRTKWSEACFVTEGGVCVQARGVGGSFRGTRSGPNRPDLIICDDIEKDELVASPENRRKLEHWLRRVVMPSLAPDGQLVVLGSMLHYDSLLAVLADRKAWPRWDYRVYRALEADTDAAGELRLRALWPARWPVGRLHEERERIGTLAFEQEYQARPADDATRCFRPEWLRRTDPAELATRADRLIHLVAVDPATGAEGRDYFALWAGCVDTATGQIDSHELQIARIRVAEQVRRILEAAVRWRPARIGIEANGYQVALKDLLDEAAQKEGLWLPTQAMTTRGDKVARIITAAAQFETGRFRLPAGLEPEVELQFLNFPKGKHDDAPDVCALALEMVYDLRGARSVKPMTGGRRAMW